MHFSSVIAFTALRFGYSETKVEIPSAVSAAADFAEMDALEAEVEDADNTLTPKEKDFLDQAQASGNPDEFFDEGSILL